MESRIQILDRLSKKWGQRVNPLIESFEDFCVCFESEAVLQLVYMAMAEYSKQSRIHSHERNREYYTDEKIEEMFIESMREDGKWAHCFMDGKLMQRPKFFEDELQNKIEGAKMMLKKLCWLKEDRPTTEDIFPFLKEEE